MIQRDGADGGHSGHPSTSPTPTQPNGQRANGAGGIKTTRTIYYYNKDTHDQNRQSIMCQQHQIIINAYQSAFQVMQDRIAELEKRVQELEPVAEQVIRVDTQPRDECVVSEYVPRIATMVHWDEPTVAEQVIAPEVPIISRRFTVEPRFINGSSMQRQGNRVLFQGKRRNIKRHDEYGEYLQFDGMRYYASNTRPYEKKAVIEACPWWSLCKNTPADREAFFDGQLRKRRRSGAMKKWDEMERLNQAFFTQWEVVDGVNVYTRHLLTPLRPAQTIKRASPTFQAMHEPEREGVVRFEVGTHNDCMEIIDITHSPAGVKYVHYRIHDGEEVHRNTVYYEQGREYFQNRGTGADYWNKEHASDFEPVQTEQP